jgi:hypothetical protein
MRNTNEVMLPSLSPSLLYRAQGSERKSSTIDGGLFNVMGNPCKQQEKISLTAQFLGELVEKRSMHMYNSRVAGMMSEGLRVTEKSPVLICRTNKE